MAHRRAVGAHRTDRGGRRLRPVDAGLVTVAPARATKGQPDPELLREVIDRLRGL
ncbi:hypothetical protein [Streptantibioticus ferralitis]|uniref:Uncharacterized protein n=1 Tax=Streptantibioticus ferralitis TaxID=236510 RepID=A0ABT5YUA6_9ACTN|nr:hypothetical protein [Streptantibioticus ferralitis]MDF2255009.1 hypothetical protein [Streptantibioticus ferralitis]